MRNAFKGDRTWIDLKTVVDNYPECMSSRVRLRNILMDLYPEEKRQINLALNVFESGIEQQIRDESFVDEKRFAAYIRKLNNEYGMHEQEAKEGICLWLQAYGISYAEPKEKDEKTRETQTVSQDDGWRITGGKNAMPTGRDYPRDEGW